MAAMLSSMRQCDQNFSLSYNKPFSGIMWSLPCLFPTERVSEPAVLSYVDSVIPSKALCKRTSDQGGLG